MAWMKVALMAEVPVDTMKQVTVDEDDVALYHTTQGWFATSDVCSHASATLTEGVLNGCIVTCPKHGGKFDVRTGAPAAFPCVMPIESFAVEIRGEDVWLDY